MMAARVQLQKHSKRFQVPTAVDENPLSMTISDSNNRDLITAFLTRVPNNPSVWMIPRMHNFNASEPMSISALLSALHPKYGKETLAMDRGDGGLYLFWIFDSSGKLRKRELVEKTEQKKSAF